MRDSTMNAITPIGWPPLKEILPKVLANKVQIYACGACCKARSIIASDLNNKNANLAVLHNGVTKLLQNKRIPHSSALGLISDFLCAEAT